MGAIIAALIRRGVRDKGLRNGSSLWLVIGAFSVLRRMYRFFAPKNETIRLGEKLRPGDDLVIRYPGEPGRKVRKEQKLVTARRLCAQVAHERERAALAVKAEGTGRRARKAKRALASLVEPRV
jgi:hypothetical protein